MDFKLQIRFKNDLLRAADYLLLNAYSMKASGLYWGKSGISIVLFEIAEYLQDSWMEEHALEIFNQSLLSRTEKCDLKNGLAGIAFSLRYLINNGFVEANLNELFDIQLQKIERNCLDRLLKKENEKEAIISILFAFTNKELVDKTYLLDLVEVWLNGEISQLLKSMDRIRLMASFPIHLWIEKLDVVIQILYFAKQKKVLLLKDKILFKQLIENYFSLYEKGRITYNLKLFYFASIAADVEIPFEDQTMKGKGFDTTNVFFAKAFSLDKRIIECQIHKIKLEENVMRLNCTNNLIESINKELSNTDTKASLFKMGRLLLYYLSKNKERINSKRIDDLLMLPD